MVLCERNVALHTYPAGGVQVLPAARVAGVAVIAAGAAFSETVVVVVIVAGAAVIPF